MNDTEQTPEPAATMQQLATVTNLLQLLTDRLLTLEQRLAAVESHFQTLEA